MLKYIDMSNLITTIKTGDYELIDSGVVQILSEELTTFIFDTILIKFEFSKDEQNPESSIKVDVSETNTIKFTLININMLTYGTTDFVKFATLSDGNDAYISFKVNSLTDKTVRSLEYSIYKKNV